MESTPTKKKQPDDSIHLAIAQATTAAEWKGVLLFQGKLIDSSGTALDPAFTVMDILAYSNRMLHKGFKIAFDPTKYPVGDVQFSMTNDGWKHLKRYLVSVSHQAGFELVAGSNKKTSATLVCQKAKAIP